MMVIKSKLCSIIQNHTELFGYVKNTCVFLFEAGMVIDYDYIVSNHNYNRDYICLETSSERKQNPCRP